MVAIEHLERFIRDANKRGVTVLLTGVQPQVETILRNVGFYEPAACICPEKDDVYFGIQNP